MKEATMAKADALIWIILGGFMGVVAAAFLTLGKPELLLTLAPLGIFVGIAYFRSRGRNKNRNNP